jgi:transcriptional regulator GlxA family with amidase domain
LSAKVQENVLFTEDDGVMTSAGVASGIDLALHIVSTLTDDYFCFKVAREIVVYSRRRGNQAQQSVFLSYRNHIHSGVHAVQDWLQEHLHERALLENLAEIACMSTRNLTRIFKQETGITVHDYITILRQERISELLKNPDISRVQIAQQCGLQSERQISRLITSN